ncbi:unnamed protein product [marine sediment metagenome]|uniref:Uncharacterized protein n=1 Tax=marine sediment metagenome TaxID=412755 RepID=X1TQI2_9ZZZZ
MLQKKNGIEMEIVLTQIIWRLAIILLTSFGVCMLVLLTQRWHGRLSLVRPEQLPHAAASAT